MPADQKKPPEQTDPPLHRGLELFVFGVKYVRLRLVALIVAGIMMAFAGASIPVIIFVGLSGAITLVGIARWLEKGEGP